MSADAKDTSSTTAMKSSAGSSSAEGITEPSPPPPPRQYHHRILCYGDSLTAGTSGMGEYPYAPHLEAALQRTGHSVTVRHRGLPGWTAAAMLDDLDGARTGLRAAIQAVTAQIQQARQDEGDSLPPLSLVILMAGTNDMGQGYGAEDIAENLRSLHRVCYENGVPRTLAVAVPPSGYQAINKQASEQAKSINEKLRAFCESQNERATFTPFPFGYEQMGDNWYLDGLHFSPQGYKVLGESLEPTVSAILKAMEAEL